VKPEPVVVFGTPHSQAAHVGALLGGHPRALALPDVRLFSCEHVGDLLALYTHGDERGLDGLLRAVAYLFCGGQQDQHIVDARRFLHHRSAWSTAALLDLITDRVAPRVAVFHDITAPLHIVELDRWLAAAPGAAFLHLLRHPVVFSGAAERAINERLYIPPDYSDHSGHPRLAPQLLWFRVHDTLEREFETHDSAAPPAAYRQVRLEELQGALGATLESLCQWLGWQHDDAILRDMCDTRRTPFAGRGPDSAPAGAESDFLNQPEFMSPLGARADTGRLAQSSLAPEIIARARSYGYG